MGWADVSGFNSARLPIMAILIEEVFPAIPRRWGSPFSQADAGALCPT